jgi:hypothetical protein
MWAEFFFFNTHLFLVKIQPRNTETQSLIFSKNSAKPSIKNGSKIDFLKIETCITRRENM